MISRPLDLGVGRGRPPSGRYREGSGGEQPQDWTTVKVRHWSLLALGFSDPGTMAAGR